MQAPCPFPETIRERLLHPVALEDRHSYANVKSWEDLTIYVRIVNGIKLLWKFSC